ncbi:MAG: type II toxin-antitoxin system VapC family toxin [Leptolyngbyaceae cyanobacterium]
MAINLTIQADIVDIRNGNDSPLARDVFWVDTNVWYWLTYTKASIAGTAQPYQIKNYPPYIAAAVQAGAQLCCSGLTLAELSSRIERSEAKLAGYDYRGGLKEYRHNDLSGRSSVVNLVDTCWQQITSSFSKLENLSIDSATAAQALTQFRNSQVDGYDLFIIENMIQHGITKIITDDGDYSTVPGIEVFTANRKVVNTARQQRRLIAR